MILSDLINLNEWLSVELTLLRLYPDQDTCIEEYKEVFTYLLNLKPKQCDILIELTCYNEETPENSYVDVHGIKAVPNKNDITNGLAIEFVAWDEWLGMEITSRTLKDFNEPEIIAHCLYEMTYFGFNETEIKDQFKSITDMVHEYKETTMEEKEKTFIDWDSFLKGYNTN